MNGLVYAIYDCKSVFFVFGITFMPLFKHKYTKEQSLFVKSPIVQARIMMPVCLLFAKRKIIHEMTIDHTIPA